jgi:hypothetical protein
MTTWRAPAADTVAQKQRRTIRYLAAAIAAITTVMYLLIGFGVLHVVDEAAADAPPLLDFGLMAGAAFGLGALLLLTMDRRVLWVLGAILQVGVIVMYVVVGQQRTPAFGLWGITIKILQVVLLGALLYLALRPPAHEDDAAR